MELHDHRGHVAELHVLRNRIGHHEPIHNVLVAELARNVSLVSRKV